MKAQAIKRGEYACATCGVMLDPDAPPNTALAGELDHVVAVAVDPSREFDPSNLRWLCHFHNRSKGGRVERPRVPTTRKW